MTLFDNPFAVVREESTAECINDVKVTHTRGYDKKGNLVFLGTYRDYPDGGRGHCVRCVEADGYWSGGAYDPKVGVGCQFPITKYVEGEIQ